jgi:hypothetical protein
VRRGGWRVGELESWRVEERRLKSSKEMNSQLKRPHTSVKDVQVREPLQIEGHGAGNKVRERERVMDVGRVHPTSSCSV